MDRPGSRPRKGRQVKLDERFMTILTALLVLVGVGAMLNRGEDGQSIFSGSGAYKANPDSFTLRAGRVQTLDVLLNDAGNERADPSLLKIVSGPHCGRAEVVDGAIQYSDSASCEGAVALTYCVPDGEEGCEETTVALNILNPDNNRTAEQEPGTPVVFDVIQQGNAPQGGPQLAMRQPKRLTLPTESEVITPQQAAEDIRNLGRDSGQAVVAAAGSDSNVVVSNTSARAGRIETSGINLQAPEPGGESLDVALAQPSAPASPGRPAAPGGLSAAPVESPSFGASPSIELSLPSPSPQSGGTAPQTELALATPQVDTSVPAVEPQSARETELAAVAPLAQSDQPRAPADGLLDTPDTAGILASLAGSNSVLSVSFTAAKALLSPVEERDSRPVAPAGVAAPRPSDIEIVAALAADASQPEAGSAQVSNIDDRRIIARGAGEIRLTSLTADPAFVPRTVPAALPPEVPSVAADETGTSGQGTQVAALSPQGNADAPLLSILPAPRPDVNCDVDMVLKVRVGAEMQATLSSPCRPETAFLVEHAGLRFTGLTDLDGVADFIIPAMTENATVSVSFGDGAFTVARAEVENMSRLTRVAIVWQGDMNFDLHAFEYGAAAESVGHIRPTYRRDYRSARRAGGGYMMHLGPETGLGARAEVYTIFESSRTKDGPIDLEVAFSGAGDACAGAPNLRAVRTDGAKVTANLDLQLGGGFCDRAAGVVVEDVVGNINLAGR